MHEAVVVDEPEVAAEQTVAQRLGGASSRCQQFQHRG
jgi:hypothetical protein